MDHMVTVRYGSMGSIAEFIANEAGWSPGDQAVVRTERGTEIGLVLGHSREVERARESQFRVVRRATEEDLAQEKAVKLERVPEEYEFGRSRIEERKLPIKLVEVEHIFGGERIIFYFVAEGRVDFRELVKDLAAEYRTRIEMRQIGARDEARLLAEYEHCGRELCCRTFIKEFEPVTMKMAKKQKSTLDPAKISGRCGRLMCCLRYESAVYDELLAKIPRVGARVQTPEGEAIVVDRDVMRQTVRCEAENHRELHLNVEDVTVIESRPRRGDDKKRTRR